MGNIVQVAVRVGMVQVDGGWDYPLLNREDTEDSLYSTGGPQEMAGHGFGGAHRQSVGVGPENRFDGFGLHFIVEGGGSAVGIDVIHLFGLEASVPQGQPHG